ncbi:hypothetical protein N7449_005770 [Penicillium cf. viridicatum]|uniref:Uncharacterized protein n=1 Tax=Penicillium cf. viridicatum TaxID=2972119 RepID=A0A9W9MGR0_9EURO|nr:hypothetical protein N7449_005770 [Penicillium cf. viridicatum]
MSNTQFAGFEFPSPSFPSVLHPKKRPDSTKIEGLAMFELRSGEPSLSARPETPYFQVETEKTDSSRSVQEAWVARSLLSLEDPPARYNWDRNGTIFREDGKRTNA